MSSAHHPKTDGMSECTNKTVIQCICYAVEQDQKGWVQALPKIHFNIMNTVNASTSFSPFHLHFGKSACILPPITPPTEPLEGPDAAAHSLVSHMATIECEAQDALLKTKVLQASTANSHRDLVFPFRVGEQVLLSTFHRRKEYKLEGNHHAAKFMPHYNGPYHVIATDEAHSTVTLDLPNNPLMFPVFHISEVKPFKENDNLLFPN